jgi:signal peptidase I
MSQQEPEPATPSGDHSPGRRLVRALVTAWWFAVCPLLAMTVVMRWLIPSPAFIGHGFWGGLALLNQVPPLALGVALFLLFAGLARLWRDRLPLREHLRPAATTTTVQDPPARRWIAPVAIVALPAAAALLLRAGVGQLYQVEGASMLPTLVPGDTILMSRLSLRDGQAPRRGDIVVFRTGPGQRGPDAASDADRLVKRVIGLPGDHIAMRGGIPQINGWEVPHCDAGTYVRYAADGMLVARLLVEFIEDRAYLAAHVPGTPGFSGYDVKPGEVFVLGDDRSNSDDSRSWNERRGGGVPIATIEGRPWRLIGADRDGHVDWGRFLQQPGTHLRLRGVDVQGLEEGIERCLKARPPRSSPPAPAQPPTMSPA